MLVKFKDTPDVDIELIDSVPLTNKQQQIINDNLLELL